MTTEERVMRAMDTVPVCSSTPEMLLREVFSEDLWAQLRLALSTAAIEAHLAALADAGLVIVPIEPTDTMVSRGAFTGDRELTRAIYRAMISYMLPEGPDEQ